MNRASVVIAASLGVIVCLIWLLAGNDGSPTNSDRSGVQTSAPIELYCAAANRAVIEAVVSDYQQETGRTVQVQYGPSQTLLSSLEITGSGDLFLPSDDSFLQLTVDKKLVREVLPIARMHAVVAVSAGNPRNVASLDDLMRDDVRLVQADADAAAIGKLTREVLTRSARWDALLAATDATRTTVTDVANDVQVGAADAGIVYDVVLHSYPALEEVRLPELQEAMSRLAVGVLAGSADAAAALHFARYLAADDRGLKRFREFGYTVGTGDKWEDRPELVLFAGSMLRPAIEDTITAFERREAVVVNRVYNGCGILVAQMQAGEHPDAYFACDREFMTKLPDLFPASLDVSQNELVILVAKGNPHQISSLRDLGRKGLRVGIGHEKQCAMGWLTQNTLNEDGVQQIVMQNVTVQAPAGDMLVNQMLTGSLDAAVVYLSNAAGCGDKLDAVRIRGLSCSLATQPIAVAVDSRQPALTARLLDALRSAESRAAFELNGFRWSE